MFSCSMWVDESSPLKLSFNNQIDMAYLLIFQMNLIFGMYNQPIQLLLMLSQKIVLLSSTIYIYRSVGQWLKKLTSPLNENIECVYLLFLLMILLQIIYLCGKLSGKQIIRRKAINQYSKWDILIFCQQQMRNFSRENQRNHLKEVIPRTLTGEKPLGGGLKETEVRVGKFKYDSHDELGKGFSSNVYKGVQILKPHKRYAIKVINLKKFRGSNIDMLQAQITIHRSLDHENIVKLYEVIKTSHHYYLVLQYCPHGNLSEYIAQKKQLTENNALQISVQIINAYKYLISEGVIHRDIKPANILRVGNKWKLSDFGFAVKSRFGFKDRMNVGTPLYMAPESLKKNYYSYKSDVYAVGIVLFEMLVGRTPHQVANECELIDKLSNEIVLPKFLKNVKTIEFLTKACQINENRRLAKQQFEQFDFGINFGQQQSIAQSLNNCSSMISLKDRKTSAGTTDDQSSKHKDSYTHKLIPSSKDASKQTSRQNSVYGNKPSSLEEQKINKNPMIANKQYLMHELEYVHHFYYTIQNIDSFHLQDNTKSMFMLTLFKLLLKLMRLLCDKGQNHFRLNNWEEYQQCRLHQEFYATLITYSQKYEKEYLQFIKHNDIKVIRAVNRKFPQLCHNSPLNSKFYENFKHFMVNVIRQHNNQVTNLAKQGDHQLNDRYQAFYTAYSFYKLAQKKISNPFATLIAQKPLVLADYTLSKRSKSDYLTIRKEIANI